MNPHGICKPVGVSQSKGINNLISKDIYIYNIKCI